MPFIISFGLGLILTAAAVRIGMSWGPVDRPSMDPLKIHGRAVPLLGGMAVAIAALVTAAFTEGVTPPALIGAVSVAVMAGLADDIWSLDVLPRLIAQVGAGVLLAAAVPIGQTEIFGLFGMVALTVACANAVNLVDGQDLLAGGLAAIAALGFAALGGLGHDELVVGIGLAVAGALTAFLLWNRPPARIFLGNNGAYGVGVLLAFLAGRVIADMGWRGLLASGLCLSLFGFEVCLTVLRRMQTGHPLARGDRRHSYDVLSSLLGGRQRVVLLAWTAGATMAGISLLVASVDSPAAISLSVLVTLLGLLGGYRLRQITPDSADPTGTEH